MAATYEPIATTTLGSATLTVTFSSIPSTYTDLVIAATGLTTLGTTLTMRFNGDTATNYSDTHLYGHASGVNGSGRNTSSNQMFLFNWYNDSQGTGLINIQNYANTTTNKTVIMRGGQAGYNVWATVGLWRNTSAINSVAVIADATAFEIGATFTLYGIAAA